VGAARRLPQLKLKGIAMSDLSQRIETMYRRDRFFASLLVVCLWATVLAVLILSWPFIPDKMVRVVVLFGAAAVLIFNTASIAAMLKHYAEDKEFIYGLDIKGLDAMRARKSQSK
jgi:ethanolamine transporter EutH